MFLPSPVQRMVLDNQELIINRLKDIRKVNLKKKHDFGFCLVFFFSKYGVLFLTEKMNPWLPPNQAQG